MNVWGKAARRAGTTRDREPTAAAHNARLFGAAAGACVLALMSALPAASQVPDVERCRSYDTAVEVKTAVAPVIPDRLLSDRRTALACLVRIIARVAPLEGSDQFDTMTLNRFLAATSAIRMFIVDAALRDKKAGRNDNFTEFSVDFGDVDSVEVTQGLSYGLRQANSDAQSNALHILVNVIDNTSLCVPLDHLYDPRLDVRGRANLLAVVSVVAPRAFAENFDNICRMLDHVEKDTTMPPQTARIVKTVRGQLARQTDRSNQSAPLPPGLERACRSYRPRWAGANLKYDGERSFTLKCEPRTAP